MTTLEFRNMFVNAQFKGYFSNKVVEKFIRAYEDAFKELEDDKEKRVIHISDGNTKMGRVPSVSLLPFLTCTKEACQMCGPQCYTARMACRRNPILHAWAVNTVMAFHYPQEFWAQLNDALKGFRFFRFFVGGDIPTRGFYYRMIEAARNNPHCQMWFFTKKHHMVTDLADEEIIDSGTLPDNLTHIFSGWDGVRPYNPHQFPETNTYEQEKPLEWLSCGNDCFHCACYGLGCTRAKSGEIIGFKKH